MALLRELPQQRRQRLLDLGERRLLRYHVGLRDLAGGELSAQQPQDVGRDLDQLSRRIDLAAQRGLLHRRDHDVRRQGQIRGFELKALIVRLGPAVTRHCAECPRTRPAHRRPAPVR